MTRCLLTLFLCAFNTCAYAQTFRLPFRSVSLAHVRSGNGYTFTNTYQFLDGQTADQRDREMMQETAKVGVLAAARWARTVGCDVGPTLAFVSAADAKLGPGYEDDTLRAGSTWVILANGRHYSDEQYALQKLRNCVRGKPGCAAFPMDILDLLDLDAACKGPAAFPMQPNGTFDQAKAQSAVVDPKRHFNLSPAMVAALDAVEQCHMAVSDWRCGGPPPTCNVFLRIDALLSLTTDVQFKHFLQPKQFDGFCDWDAATCCKWARLEDAAMHAWVEGVKAGDWHAARQGDNDHQIFHDGMNYQDPKGRLRLLRTCGKPLKQCPIQPAGALVGH